MSGLNHIAVILDGNRRFAKKQGKLPWKGHSEGAKIVEKFINWCVELGIKEATFFAFSTENFNRSKEEVSHLMDLFGKWFNKLSKDKSLKKKGIRINFVGKMGMLPPSVQLSAKKLMRETENNNVLTVNFALAYGSRMEIIEAVKSISKECINGKINPENITEDMFNNRLYLKSQPDMLVRPGGEKRISNFLLWQAAYSELYFIDKMWPEFTKEDLIAAIREYENRERRFGK